MSCSRARGALKLEEQIKNFEGVLDMRRLIAIIVASSTLGLSACDAVDSDLERAVVGAAIGCAAGQVLVDGRCVEGAIVGAGVGVLID
jgi:hypothetical protein